MSGTPASVNTPFGFNSVVPELQSAPPTRTATTLVGEYGIPTCLRLSDGSRKEMEHHIDALGVDQHRFDYSIKQQQQALVLFSNLGLYIPDRDDRDVQSKLSVQRTNSKFVGGKSSERRWKRYTRIYQCQCGIDHTIGRRAAKENNRQVPWKNVSCWCWIKLVTTHDEHHSEDINAVVAIDEISGLFDHSIACEEQIEMDRNPRIPLHPELRLYALSLLYNNSPLSLLRSECLKWAQNKWGDLPGDKHFRYKLNNHDSSSLYRTMARERRIPQRSAAEANLDKWFRESKPSPPSPLLMQSCLHYQAHQEPSTDRFPRIRIYSDGSGIDGKIGAAAVLYRDGIPKHTLRYQLGSDHHHTVYEGEGVGIILGLELLRKEAKGSVTRVRMGVDNQAAITSTASIKPKPAHYLWDMLDKRLNLVMNRHPNAKLAICWMPGHEGIDGNEWADEVAKEASQLGSSPSKDLPATLRKSLVRTR
ncbi:hypothetical protein BD779DRAFT_1675634 [Infundibulicybe gibba]|nr:hypothetical protein BD779DRAFT_1675634 [Infundibulicybe gibba]